MISRVEKVYMFKWTLLPKYGHPNTRASDYRWAPNGCIKYKCEWLQIIIQGLGQVQVQGLVMIDE